MSQRGRFAPFGADGARGPIGERLEAPVRRATQPSEQQPTPAVGGAEAAKPQAPNFMPAVGAAILAGEVVAA